MHVSRIASPQPHAGTGPGPGVAHLDAGSTLVNTAAHRPSASSRNPDPSYRGPVVAAVDVPGYPAASAFPVKDPTWTAVTTALFAVTVTPPPVKQMSCAVPADVN